ncbi:MAG: hypothetical protein AAF708_09470 [Deinococcota bacterium]
MVHLYFRRLHVWRIASLLGLLTLAACSRHPSPADVPLPNETSPLLGVAELGTGLKTQTLISGLQFQAVETEVVDDDGLRIKQVTFEVVNTSGTDMNSLTLYGVQTAMTVEGTNISNVRNSFGDSLTDTVLIQTMLAAHGRAPDGSIDPDKADLLVVTDADQAYVTTLLDETFEGHNFVVLDKGYAVSNISGQSDRAIPAGETGVVTIATQYPYDAANPASYPDAFLLSFAVVMDTAPTDSESFQLLVSGLGVSAADGATSIETVITNNVQGAFVTVQQ